MRAAGTAAAEENPHGARAPGRSGSFRRDGRQGDEGCTEAPGRDGKVDRRTEAGTRDGCRGPGCFTFFTFNGSSGRAGAGIARDPRRSRWPTEGPGCIRAGRRKTAGLCFWAQPARPAGNHRQRRSRPPFGGVDDGLRGAFDGIMAAKRVDRALKIRN